MRKPITVHPVVLASKAVGSQDALAKAVKVTPQAIGKWKRSRIPAERVLDVERVTGVSRHLLRPDLYPASTAA